MSDNHENRLQETVKLLDEQLQRLPEIQREFYTAYAAVFDRQGAIETTKRWHDRTTKIIRDRVSPAEAEKFRHLLSLTVGIRGALEFEQWLRRFSVFLDALLQDIQNHPNDPTFDRLLQPQASRMPAHSNSTPFVYDVFLSYSSIDKDEARQIHSEVEQSGKKCFLAGKNLKPGDTFTDEIRNALKGAKEIWLLVSPNSIKSEWVQRESAAAWALEKRIVPILLRCSPAHLPDFLAQTHAIDYHNVTSLISNLT